MKSNLLLKKENIIYLILFLYAVIATLSIIFFNGTVDTGDSITHYLFAKYAPLHHVLFFDHWAKPIYVLLFSPFAQFGFIGIKVFNTLIALITIYVTYKTAKVLNLKNFTIVAIIMMFSPLYYILTFSGLTDLLFALLIAVCIYLCVKEKYLIASIVVSFSPFIRSEGLIIIGVFGLYFLFKRKWKIIPLLLLGHIAYSIAGYFVFKDFLWVFNQIPYANMGSPYGHGKLMHFVDQLIYVIGVPIYFLFWIGFICMIWKTFRKKIKIEESILVLFGFICFFVAHTLFWYLGIFNSMGLNRVLIGVLPMISLIALYGFNFLTEEILGNKKTIKVIIKIFLIGYILVFPFTSNPAAINWKKDMMLSGSQISAINAASFIKNNWQKNHRIIFAHPYVCEALQFDFFDPNISLNLNKYSLAELKTGDIVIWDNWFAVVESHIQKEELHNNPELTNIYNSSEFENGRNVVFAVYEKKDTTIIKSNISK